MSYYGYGSTYYGAWRSVQNSQVGWRLIEPAAHRPLTDIEVMDHLRIDHKRTEEIDLMRRLLDAATEEIEGRGHILMPQTWEMLLDEFPCGYWWPYRRPIQVFKNPVLSVDFIKYIDLDGVEQIWDSSKYKVAAGSIPARIQPSYGNVWPSARCEPEAVTIRFTAGYDDSPATIPRLLMSAMLLLIGHLHENREAVIEGRIGAVEIPWGIESLIEKAIGRARVY